MYDLIKYAIRGGLLPVIYILLMYFLFLGFWTENGNFHPKPLTLYHFQIIFEKTVTLYPLNSNFK